LAGLVLTVLRDINLPGVNTTGNQNTTGSAATLTTARTIGGVSFNGSADIDLPGVNTTGNQNTTGSAATLTTARTINGVSFNGSANITVADATKMPLTGGTFTGNVSFGNFAITDVQTITVDDAIISTGDTNTYIQFHAADQWRVVTGGSERLEVNNTNTTIANNLIVSGATTLNGNTTLGDAGTDTITVNGAITFNGTVTGIQSGAIGDIFWENGQAVTSNYTITTNKNAMSAGPISINSGVTVTVPSGSTWTVV
jgi:hypothetical protein